MPPTDSPAIIVARFLKANHYGDTLEAFIKEAGLPPDAGTLNKGDLTIEKILEEKKIFDLSIRFEKFGDGDALGWTLPAPSTPFAVSTLPTSTNLLHVSVESYVEEGSDRIAQVLIVTGADRRFNLLSPDSAMTLLKSDHSLHDSPILSCAVLGNKYLTSVTTSMSGQVILYDHVRGKVLEERRDHRKYVVKVATWEGRHGTWVTTAGWDAKVLLYRVSLNDVGEALALGPPVASISLPTNPEAVLFVKHPDEDTPILIVTRRDSTSLHYYRLPSLATTTESVSSPAELQLIGRQNLAPHSNAWIAFSPSSIAISPIDPTLLAVATSAVPHMKLIIARLLVPPLGTIERSPTHPQPATQAAQARADLAVQDKEDAAILIHASTLAPQTPYSTPQVCWRPDGSGIWVNGDDGALRGVEAKTGKIIVVLKGGHEIGSKIRSIWAGLVVGSDDGAREEWVVSGGFDRRLVVWKAAVE
ncbi:MAG: hypothetical protein FRX48_00129 [Lasallia pustulata]|uniref:LisH domain-containing protein n=1 Tax=Lasallia pustulata TaxID=136370 RepID=A0A5M8PZU9_9LECA|nr:MAG: hypothetical protein FRX48_00129 [Lasallia pustulata]